MTLHPPTLKIYLHLMSPASACAPQTTPCYMLLLLAVFQKVTGLSQFIPRSSGILYRMIFGQLALPLKQINRGNLIKHFFKHTSIGRSSLSKPIVFCL